MSAETVFALALGVGVLAQALGSLLRIPSIVLLFGAGLLLGPDGLGWIEPRALGKGLFALVSISVAVILFEGALNLDLKRLRREGRTIRSLVTTGALVTWVGATCATRALLGWSWKLSILFGAMVIVTGPTVIGPLLRSLRVKPSVATVLEAEGVLIDPIGAIVAALALEAVLAPDAGSLEHVMRRLERSFIHRRGGGPTHRRAHGRQRAGAEPEASECDASRSPLHQGVPSRHPREWRSVELIHPLRHASINAGDMDAAIALPGAGVKHRAELRMGRP